ncbi:RNA helicase family protein [Trifolium repens]|nr:RNA helicase family protein [Trifolium repens]
MQSSSSCVYLESLNQQFPKQIEESEWFYQYQFHQRESKFDYPSKPARNHLSGAKQEGFSSCLEYHSTFESKVYRSSG